jgi:hypothetical protein
MSASEKLKALDEAFDTSRFLAMLNYYIGPGARTAGSREGEQMYWNVKGVLVALPQIVAVVEAAEETTAEIQLHGMVTDHAGGYHLRTALAALDEALS